MVIEKIKLEVEKPTPLYLIVKKKVIDLIREGRLKEGDRLPPEEEIAKENRISRGTVRQALEELEKEGIIVRYPKRGTFIKSTDLKVKRKIQILSSTNPKSKESKSFYPFELWGGIEEGMIEKNLEVSFSNSEEISKDVEGILFITPLIEEMGILKKIREKEIPIMIAGAKVEGFNYVAVDNEMGVKMAIEMFVKKGFKKIGGVFPPLSFFDINKRYESFFKYVKYYYLETNENWIKIIEESDADKWIEYAELMTEEIFKEDQTPQVMFGGDGVTGIGIRLACEKMGIEIPEDISLICFDDFYLTKYYQITCISQPVWEIGKKSIEGLCEIIERGGSYQLLLKPELKIRGSVGSFARKKKHDFLL